MRVPRRCNKWRTLSEVVFLALALRRQQFKSVLNRSNHCQSRIHPQGTIVDYSLLSRTI